MQEVIQDGSFVFIFLDCKRNWIRRVKEGEKFHYNKCNISYDYKIMKYEVKGLNKLSKQLNEFVKKAGFDNNDVPLRTALIYSEIGEMFEAFRKDQYANKLIFEYNQEINGVDFELAFEAEIKDSLEDELADSIIRLLDLVGKLDIDIEFHIQQKMRYNETRGFKYGGKKF